jgi:hypothetical protein
MHTRPGRTTVSVLASFALLVLAPDCFSLVYVGPKDLPDDARNVMDEFQQALRTEDWDRALALCSQEVKNAAKKFKSPKVFLEEYLPLEDLWKAEEFPVSGSWSAGEEPGGELVKYQGSFLTDGLSWKWTLQRTGDAWLIDFKTIPISQQKAETSERIERWRREYEAKRAAFLPKMKGLEARLTAAKREFLPGEPVPVRLELVHGGENSLWYDAQQVALNDPLFITDQEGKKVPYTADWYQTCGGFRPIKPGETVVLLDGLDLARQYAIDRPGKYTVQWLGNGVRLKATGDIENTDDLGMTGVLESNPVEIVVREVKE